MIQNAILLAQGQASRMAPFDQVRPKCLLPVLGKPLLTRTIAQLTRVGVERVVVVAGQKFSPQIEGWIDGPGAELVVEHEARGSSTSAALGQRSIAPGEPLLILESDALIDGADIELLAQAVEGGAQAAALVLPMGAEDPRDWIVARRSGDQIDEFLGYPRSGLWRVAGAFALSAGARSALGAVRRPGLRTEVGGMPPQEYELCESLNAMLERGGQVTAVVAGSPVVQLKKPWHILAANRVALDEALANTREGTAMLGPGSVIEDGVIIRGRVVVGRNSTVRSGVILQGSVFIGNDCVIEDYAKVSNAVIGDRCVVSHSAEILGGVLMDNVFLMHSCEVFGILGDNVDIGAHTVFGTLRFDDSRTAHRVKQRWEAPREGADESYLAEYVRTGVNVTILPGKKVGPYSAIGPGVVVEADIPARTLVRLQQELRFDPWGPERYGW